MADQYAREPFDSRSASVDTTNWVSAVVMCFVVIVKLAFKWTRSRKFQIEDFFILAAMALALGQSIALSKQVSNGLGQHQFTLTLSQAQSYRSPYYAAQILYVAAVCATKLVIASILAKMRMIPRWIIAAGIIVGLSVSWAFAVMSALSVRCVGRGMGMNTPMSCMDEVSIWKASGVVDIVTDFMLVALAALVVIQAQASLKTRLAIILSFATKLICIPLIVLRIRYLETAIRSMDGTYEAASAAITTQLAMNVGIITTCIPYIKSFLSHMDHGTFTYDYRLKAARRKAHGNEIEKATSLEAAFAEASQTSQQRQAQAAAMKSPQRGNTRASPRVTRTPPRVTPQKRRSGADHGYRVQRSPRRQGIRPKRYSAALGEAQPAALSEAQPAALSEAHPAALSGSQPRHDSVLMPGPEDVTSPTSTNRPEPSSPRDLDQKPLPALLAISPSASDREIQKPLTLYQRRSTINRRRSDSQRGERRLSRLLSQVSPDTIIVRTPERHPPMSLTNTLAVLEEMQASERRSRRSTQIIPASRRKPSAITIKRRAGTSSTASSAAAGHQPLLTPVLEISPSGSSIEPDKPSPLRISPAKWRHEDGRTFLDVSSNTSHHNDSPPGSRGQRSTRHSHEKSSSSESRRRRRSAVVPRYRPSSRSRSPVSPLEPQQQQQPSSNESRRQVTPPSRDEPPTYGSLSHSPEKRPQTAASSETRLQTAKSNDTIATAPEYQPFDLTMHDPTRRPGTQDGSNDGLAHSPAGSRTPEEEQLIQDHKHLQVPTFTLNRSYKTYEQHQERNQRQQQQAQQDSSAASRPRSISQTSSRFYAPNPLDRSPSSVRPLDPLKSNHSRDISSTSADSDQQVTALPQLPAPTASTPDENVSELRLVSALPPLPEPTAPVLPQDSTSTNPTNTASTSGPRTGHGYNTSSSSTNPTSYPSNSGPSGSGPSAASMESPHLHPSPTSDKKRAKAKADRHRPDPLKIVHSNGSSADVTTNVGSAVRPVLGGNVMPAPLGVTRRDAHRNEVEGERARTPRSPLGSAKMVIRKLTTFGTYREGDGEGSSGVVRARTGDGRDAGVWRG